MSRSRNTPIAGSRAVADVVDVSLLSDIVAIPPMANGCRIGARNGGNQISYRLDGSTVHPSSQAMATATLVLTNRSEMFACVLTKEAAQEVVVEFFTGDSGIIL